MHIFAVVGILGILMMLFSIVLFVSAGVAYIYEENTARFFVTCGVCFLLGGSVYFPLKRYQSELRNREGFLITSACYVGLGLLGALPFWLTPDSTLSFTNAAFESFSGLTTTGATVMTGLDEMPRSILFYRQLLQWLGGMGIIVLALAILPLLGVGGMQLYRAEAPGTITDDSFKPRIAETAKTLWFIYIGLTAVAALSYWIAGMSIFDAICHSFSTIAIGGFSTHDASIGYFQNPVIETIAIVFMLIAGINFALHYKALRSMWSRPKFPVTEIKRVSKTLKYHLSSPWRFLSHYTTNHEVRLYLGIVAVLVLLIFVRISLEPESTTSFGQVIFQSVSFATTTGFAVTDVESWPMFCSVLLVWAAFAGGCVGSTAGGIKIYRLLVLARQGVREIRRLIYPDGVFLVKLGKNVIPDRVLEAVWGFFAVYVALFLLLLTLVLAASDLDIRSAFSAVAACLNNLGPGLGEVSTNYQELNDPVKWILIAAMLLGRLEVFTLLVLLSPHYWRN